VGGEANIENGNLAVQLSGYVPHGGETYTLLTAGSITGTNFLNTDLTMAPLPSGLTWDLNVGATSVVLKVLGSIPLPGDYDGDHDVDGNDFLVWQRGQSPAPGSAADLGAWKANFGTAAQGAATSAVPEPAGIVLTLLATAGLPISHAARRRTRRATDVAA
jgi:hypothetical protein